MTHLDVVAGELDASSSARVTPALTWLSLHGARDAAPDASLLREYLLVELPRAATAGRDVHEVAWALGDLFERAGLGPLAEMCRSPETHEALAVWRWTRSFPGVPSEFWDAALAVATRRSDVPSRAALSVSSARALLEAVGDGVRLTADGQLPLSTVLALDDRFRWSEEFPWLRRGQEADVAPLRILRDHLEAQRLLARDGDRLVRTDHGERCATSTARLWRALAAPAPRWDREFELDALAVMAASVLRSADFTLGRVAEEMTHVLAAKWRPTADGPGGAGRSGLYDGASALAQAWYQLGVPLGWWDTGKGLADRRPNTFGRAAAVGVFRAVAAPRQGPLRRAANANTRW
jgi:hypothetical protein